MSSVVLKVWIDFNANAVFAFFNQAPLGNARPPGTVYDGFFVPNEMPVFVSRRKEIRWLKGRI